MNKSKNCSCLCNHKNGCQSQSDNYLIKLYIDIQKDKQVDNFQVLKSKLTNLPGVKEVEFNGNILEVLYDDMIISPNVIKEMAKIGKIKEKG